MLGFSFERWDFFFWLKLILGKKKGPISSQKAGHTIHFEENTIHLPPWLCIKDPLSLTVKGKSWIFTTRLPAGSALNTSSWQLLLVKGRLCSDAVAIPPVGEIAVGMWQLYVVHRSKVVRGSFSIMQLLATGPFLLSMRPPRRAISYLIANFAPAGNIQPPWAIFGRHISTSLIEII